MNHHILPIRAHDIEDDILQIRAHKVDDESLPIRAHDDIEDDILPIRAHKVEDDILPIRAHDDVEDESLPIRAHDDVEDESLPIRAHDEYHLTKYDGNVELLNLSSGMNNVNTIAFSSTSGPVIRYGTASSTTSITFSLNYPPSDYTSGTNAMEIDFTNATDTIIDIENLEYLILTGVAAQKITFTNKDNLKRVCGDIRFKDNTLPDEAFKDMFKNCSELISVNLSSLKITGTIPNEAFYYMFYKCSSVEQINLGTIEATGLHSGGYQFHYMFYYCTSLKKVSANGTSLSSLIDYTVDFSGLNILSTADSPVAIPTYAFAYMFNNCSTLEQIDLGTIEASILDSGGWQFRSMFLSCTSLRKVSANGKSLSSLIDGTVDFSGIDISPTADSLVAIPTYAFAYMFSDCSNLVNIDLGTIQASILHSGGYQFYSMFSGCTSLRKVSANGTSLSSFIDDTVDFSGLDISSTADSPVAIPTYAFARMFFACTQINTVDFGTIVSNTVNSHAFNYMFYLCSNLERIDFGNVNITGTIHNNSFNYIVAGCASLSQFIIHNASNVIKYFGTQEDAVTSYSVDKKITLPYSFTPDTSSETSSETSDTYTYNLNVPKITYTFPRSDTLDITLNEYTNEHIIFKSFKNNKSIKHVTFHKSGNYAVNLNASCFDRFATDSNVESVDFSALSLNNQPVYGPSFNSSFYNCAKLKHVNLGTITGDGTIEDGAFYTTFYNCTSLKKVSANGKSLSSLIDGTVDFSGLNITGTISFEAFSYMFYNCSTLEQIDLGTIKASGLHFGGKQFNGMFQSCTSLRKVSANGKSLSSLSDGTVDFSGINISQDIPTSAFHLMFSDCSNLANIDLGTIQASGLHSGGSQFRTMFYYCTSLKKVSANGKSLSSLIDGTVDFSGLNITGTIPTLAFRLMFSHCSNLANIDLGTIQASGLDSDGMQFLGMFQSCTSLKKVSANGTSLSSLIDDIVDFSGLNITGTIPNDAFNRMFFMCTQIKIVNFGTIVSTDLKSECFINMFYICSNLERIDFGNVNITGTIDNSSFVNIVKCCVSLSVFIIHKDSKLIEYFGTQEDAVTSYRVIKKITLPYSFTPDPSETSDTYTYNLNVPKITYTFPRSDTLDITLNEYTTEHIIFKSFKNNKSIKHVTFHKSGNYDVKLSASYFDRFATDSNVESVDFSALSLNNQPLYESSFHTSFYNCAKLKHVNLGTITGDGTIEPTAFARTFYNCASLEKVSASGQSLDEISIGTVDFSSLVASVISISTDKLPLFYKTFYNCHKIVNVDFSALNTPELTDDNKNAFTEMFSNCENLQHLRINADGNYFNSTNSDAFKDIIPGNKTRVLYTNSPNWNQFMKSSEPMGPDEIFDIKYSLSATASGDPYITSLDGCLYKLPNKTAVYRLYKDTHTTINGHVSRLNEKLINENTSLRALKMGINSKFDFSKMYYFDKIYIRNKGNETIYDFNTNSFTNDCFDVVKEETLMGNCALYKNNQILKISVDLQNVVFSMCIFDNPQALTGVELYCKRFVNDISGLLTKKQSSKEQTLKKLHSNAETKCMIRKGKIVNEMFYDKDNSNSNDFSACNMKSMEICVL